MRVLPGLEVALQPGFRLVLLVRQEEFDSFLQFLPYFFTRNNASIYLTKASNLILLAENALSYNVFGCRLPGQKLERFQALFQE